MIRGVRVGFVVALAALSLAACGSPGTTTVTVTKTATVTTPTAGGNGAVRTAYDTPANATEQLAAEVLKAGGTDGIAQGFTRSFRLPANITIHSVSGDVGPNYDPQTRTVTLSYGFVDFEAGVLRRANPGITDYHLGGKLAAVDAFIITHEMGHAFVDLYQLPITGKEEDAVDALAAVFLTQFVNHGDQYAFEAADFFHTLAQDKRHYSESDFFDEHSLDAQRAYEIVCWIAGSSEQDYKNIARTGILSTQRLQRCPAEYEQKVKAWFTLLRPYARPS